MIGGEIMKKYTKYLLIFLLGVLFYFIVTADFSAIIPSMFNK